MENKVIEFKEWKCTLGKRRYNNGRIALTLNDKFDGLPIATATVNLPDNDLPKDHVFIKSWSENEGIYEALLKADIIEPYTSKVKTGFVEAYMCKLKAK